MNHFFFFFFCFVLFFADNIFHLDVHYVCYVCLANLSRRVGALQSFINNNDDDDDDDDINNNNNNSDDGKMYQRQMDRIIASVKTIMQQTKNRLQPNLAT